MKFNRSYHNRTTLDNLTSIQRSASLTWGPSNKPRWSLHLLRGTYGRDELRTKMTLFVTTPWFRFEIGGR